MKMQDTIRVRVPRPGAKDDASRRIVRELERKAQRSGKIPPAGNWPKPAELRKIEGGTV